MKMSDAENAESACSTFEARSSSLDRRIWFRTSKNMVWLHTLSRHLWTQRTFLSFEVIHFHTQCDCWTHRVSLLNQMAGPFVRDATRSGWMIFNWYIWTRQRQTESYSFWWFSSARIQNESVALFPMHRPFSLASPLSATRPRTGHANSFISAAGTARET